MCVESAVFCCFPGAFQWFSCTFHEKCLFSWKKKPRSICVHTCTIYTYKINQMPIKYNIYIVGIPSVLMKHQVIMRDLCWIRCFCCFSMLFTKNASFHKKSMTFHENHQNQINMCVYMYHLHIHAPHAPRKYKILIGTVYPNYGPIY